MSLQQLGNWAFLLGVIIAVLAGIGTTFMGMDSMITAWILFVLVILGIVVGFLNIEDKEVTPFLVAAIALLATSGAIESFRRINLVLPTIGTLIYSIVAHITVFVAPAAIIVALVSIKNLAGKAKAGI